MHVKPEGAGMSPSPTANRSFLHGNRPPCLNSNKVVYATLDSLALRRARLPLRLLPVDDNNIVDKPERNDKEKKAGHRKASPRRPSFKVNNHFNSYFRSFQVVDFYHEYKIRKYSSGMFF